MGAAQCRQRPRSNSQENRGTLSQGAIGVSHEGHFDRGATTDSLRGTRQITTLRNDPITRPKIPATTATNAVIDSTTALHRQVAVTLEAIARPSRTPGRR